MKGVNNTTTMDIDYQSDLNTDGSKKSGNGSGGGGQDPMSPQQQLLQGLAYS
jgi:hypothetical protein